MRGFRNSFFVCVVGLASVVLGQVDDLQHSLKNPAPGVELGAVLSLEMVSNLEGGISRETGYLGSLDLTVEVDTEEAGFWKNGTFFVYGLGTFGDNPSEYVGDFQGTSNIEAPKTFTLFETWYEHALVEDTFYLLAGLHGYDSEFDALEYAGLFFNGSFGTAPDISQTGPAVFPTSALAVRGRLELENGGYVLAGAYD